MTTDSGELELGLQPRPGIVGDKIDGVGGYHARVMVVCEPCSSVQEGDWNCIGSLTCDVCGKHVPLIGFGIYPNDTPAPEGRPV